MIALDTNVLARLILRDSPAEYQIAAELIANHACSVSWTVLVELSWVLERSARLSRDEIAAAIGTIGDIDRIAVPDDRLLAWAVDRYRQGADFADMIHLVSTLGGSASFASFDRKLQRQAGAHSPLPVTTLRG